MDETQKKEIVTQLQHCVILLETSGVNSKQIVKNTLNDIIDELQGESNAETGLPF